LGFSVAVHVEPQILIIDEVIAVGDEEFQRRCFEHLHKLRRQGATIVMVTHGLNFVQSLCDEATWLDHGHVLGQGESAKVVRKYMSLVNEQEVERLEHAAAAVDPAATDHEAEERRHGAIASIEGIEFLDENKNPLAVATVFEPITFRLHFRASKPIRTPLMSFVLFTEGGQPVVHPGLRFKNDDAPVVEGDGYVDFHVPRFSLAKGLYTISVAMHDRPGGIVLDRKDDAYQLHVQPGEKNLWGMAELAGEWGEVQAPRVDASRLTD
jgi:ABC-2 type transport system ATP-binding protein/lipopolysaccharide transport system ATP-binding protein